MDREQWDPVLDVLAAGDVASGPATARRMRWPERGFYTPCHQLNEVVREADGLWVRQWRERNRDA